MINYIYLDRKQTWYQKEIIYNPSNQPVHAQSAPRIWPMNECYVFKVFAISQSKM